MISPDQLEAHLDAALDASRAGEVEAALESDPDGLQFLLEQRRMDRMLRSLLAPAARRERIREAIRVAIAGSSAERLRAQVLADTSGSAPPHPVRLPIGRRRRFGAWLTELFARFPMPRLAGFAIASVTVLAVFAWVLLRPTPPQRVVIGTISGVSGQPTVSTGASQPPLAAGASTPIHLGDRLETGDADHLEARFLDGTTLRLGFNTAVEIRNPKSEVRTPKPPPARPGEIGLLRGRVWTKVQKTTNATQYAVVTDVATAVARGTEFGVSLQRAPRGRTQPGSRSPKTGGSPLAILTVKEGTVDFSNTFGTVQATAMTESTAGADAAPTEPKRVETLQVVQLDSGVTWSLLSSPLDWPEAATRLVGGGGSVGWDLRDLPGANGELGVRISRLPTASPAMGAGLRLGDAIVGVDGQSVTNARQVAAAILFRPGGAVNLRVRRESGEESVAVAVTATTNALSGPALPGGAAASMDGLLREWLSESAEPAPDASAESRRSDQVAGLSRTPAVRAAAFNQLGVAYELDDALAPAVRAYGRAVHLEPDVALYRFNLGLALRKIGNFERALEEFETAARLEPDSVPARKRVADVTSLLGRHEEALRLTEALLQPGAADPAVSPASALPIGESARKAGEGAARDHSLRELKAQLLFKLRRPGEAVAAARMAVGLDPDCPVAHSYLAEAYHEAGRLDEALAAGTEALDHAPFEAVLHLNLGRVQLDLGQATVAAQSFRRAIELRPDFTLAHLNLGEALADAGEPAAAAVSFQRARELDPGDAAAHRRFGDMLLRSRQFAPAERAYRDALELTPDNPEAWYGLGEACRLQRRSADAERAYRKAIELRPDYAAPHTALGIVSYERGEVDEAERLYRRAIELNPAEAAPYHNLGTLHRETRGDLDAAERWFRQALERAPEDGESLGGLGLVASARGDLAEAERLLRQAVERTSDSSALHNNLGEVLRQRGRPDEAEPFYKKALELDPDNAAPYGNLGILQAERKQFAEAEKTFRALLDRSSGNARLPTLVNLATVCGEQGKLDEAENLFRRALELAPDHPRVSNSLAAFLADHRLKLDEALVLATRAVEAGPDDPQFLDTLGWVQAQRGDLDAAESTLKRALPLAGEEPPAEEIREHLRQLEQRRAPTTR